MIYITGDTHGDFFHIQDFCRRQGMSYDDIMIILGDAGINYYDGNRLAKLKKSLSALPITFFCIHGNHEKRPQTIAGYTEEEWHGGMAFIQKTYPSLIFAKDGEIYDLDGLRCIAIGGAYSVDKYYRLENKWGWWADEQPSEKIKGTVEKKLQEADWQVDRVLSHTCPYKYIPTETFLSFIDQSTVDNSTEEWLGQIEARTEYGKWYCGHYHTDKTIDHVRFMFEDIDELK